jgi:DNA-binding XRE family transcriptional regulator
MSNVTGALHNRVAVLRAERKISRQDLADALGINYQTVGFLERGDYNPSLTLALDVAEYFHLPVEAVFSRKPFAPLHQLMRQAAVAELSAVAEQPAKRGKR